MGAVVVCVVVLPAALHPGSRGALLWLPDLDPGMASVFFSFSVLYYVPALPFSSLRPGGGFFWLHANHLLPGAILLSSVRPARFLATCQLPSPLPPSLLFPPGNLVCIPLSNPSRRSAMTLSELPCDVGGGKCMGGCSYCC